MQWCPLGLFITLRTWECFFFYFFLFFLAFYGFIDKSAEDMTGNRGERGEETRSKGAWVGSQTRVRCRASAHGTHALPTELNSARTRECFDLSFAYVVDFNPREHPWSLTFFNTKFTVSWLYSSANQSSCNLHPWLCRLMIIAFILKTFKEFSKR